jgi:hypothetical protein
MADFDWEKINARELTLQRISKACAIPIKIQLSNKLRTLLADLILNQQKIDDCLSPYRSSWLRDETRARSLRSLFIRRKKLCSDLLYLDQNFRREFLAIDRQYSDPWIELATAVIKSE